MTMTAARDIERIETASLRLEYWLVPWDTAIAGRPVAELVNVSILEPVAAGHDYGVFVQWLFDQQVALCSCRMPQQRVGDIMFLEDKEFRFVELNYIPQMSSLSRHEFTKDDISVQLADDADRNAIADMAESAFEIGRFHQDPRISPSLGNRRYRRWLINAFANDGQQVIKCCLDDDIVGFFVIEYPQVRHSFWSLCALAPSVQGRGLGKRVWEAVLRWQQAKGIENVSTSISSHNSRILNLYVTLGFRFPPPTVTLHWRPREAGILT